MHAAASVEARLERSRVVVGEPTTFEVVVSGVSAGIEQPEFDLPDGLEILSTGRTQNFSWINGQSSSQTIFRYDINAREPGRYKVGPVHVRVGRDIFESTALVLEATSSAPQLGGAGGARGGGTQAPGNAPASLIVDVTPSDPWVGEPVTLRVRLVQRRALAEDPQYGPPSTTGFWAEPSSRPESYYASEEGRQVLVTETRARLYPIAAGLAVVGPAVAGLTFVSDNGAFGLPFFGLGTRRRIEVRSTPVSVRVKALPRGAPPGFAGAVGSLEPTWSADRTTTSQDVAVSVSLDVRGVGNLPMVHTPALVCDEGEVFPGPVDDSLAAPGSNAPSRRRFRWTVLARHPGTLRIPPPEFAWFDPRTASYQRAALPAIEIQVGPPVSPGNAGGPEAFPTVFREHPVDPRGRGAWGWAWGLAGVLLGGAVVLLRGARPDPDETVERARQREWLRASRLSGPDFWRAAEDASAWLEARGAPVADLRRDIATARYGGGRTDPEPIRARLVAALERAFAPPAKRIASAIGGALAIVLAVALAILGAPRWGEPGAAARALAADRRAQAMDVEAARAAWLALWNEGARAPGLAARLSWAALRDGDTAGATAWALRGTRGEARDPALRWAWERVREAGGLAGAIPARVPLRSTEWAVLALAFGAMAGLLWPRRAWSGAVLAVALACALAMPLASWVNARVARGVVRNTVVLEGANLELTPGEVVTVDRREKGKLWVRAGRDVSGWLPEGAIEELE